MDRYETSHIRCGRCCKPKSLDIGPGVFGQPEVFEFCDLGCSAVTPSTSWASDIRTAVRAVVAGKASP